MNWKKVYFDICAFCKSDKRAKHNGVFVRHHIKPKFDGGEGKDELHENVVLLTPREHYFVHCLLRHVYPEGKLHRAAVYAFWRMNNDVHNPIKNSRLFQRSYYENNEARKQGKKEHVLTEQQRQNMRDAQKQRHKVYPHPRSNFETAKRLGLTEDEVKKQRSENNPMSYAFIMKKYNCTKEEAKLYRGKSGTTGHKHSEQAKQLMSQRRKEYYALKDKVVLCQHY